MQQFNLAISASARGDSTKFGEAFAKSYSVCLLYFIDCIFDCILMDFTFMDCIFFYFFFCISYFLTIFTHFLDLLSANKGITRSD